MASSKWKPSKLKVPEEPKKGSATRLRKESKKNIRGSIASQASQQPTSFVPRMNSTNPVHQMSVDSTRYPSVMIRNSSTGTDGLNQFNRGSRNQQGSFQKKGSLNQIPPQGEDSRRNTYQNGSIGNNQGGLGHSSPRGSLSSARVHTKSITSDGTGTNRNSKNSTLETKAPETALSLALKDSEHKRLMREKKEMKLQDALSEKPRDQRHSESEVDTRAIRLSGTVRRYSDVPPDHRVTLNFRDILMSDRVYVSTTHSMRSTDGSPSTNDQNFYNSKMYDKAKQSIQAIQAQTSPAPTLASPKTSLRNRQQEEHEMQEMDGARLIRYLVIHTHFTEAEVKSLQTMYHKFIENYPDSEMGMTRIQFREILAKHFGITGEAMMDQICHYFDTDHIGYITLTKWVRNLSTFLRGTFEEHTKFCFNIYDLKGEGAIGKNEILTLLQDCLIPVRGVEEDMTDSTGVREIADMIFKKFDRDKLGSISLADFRYVVRRDPLSLQCLGQCLPDPRDAKSFMALISVNYNYFKTSYSLPRMSNYEYERDRFNATINPIKFMGAVKKARTAMNVVQKLIGKGPMVSYMKNATNKLLKGDNPEKLS